MYQAQKYLSLQVKQMSWDHRLMLSQIYNLLDIDMITLVYDHMEKPVSEWLAEFLDKSKRLSWDEMKKEINTQF